MRIQGHRPVRGNERRQSRGANARAANIPAQSHDASAPSSPWERGWYLPVRTSLALLCHLSVSNHRFRLERKMYRNESLCILYKTIFADDHEGSLKEA